MYHRHPHANTSVMLPVIQRECGIFMSPAQYSVLCSLSPDVISVLYNNKAKFAQLMFFNNPVFDALLRLSSDDLGIFFGRARFGAVNDIELQLASLLAQSRPASVAVVQNGAPSFPSYRAPYVTGTPSTMFYTPPSAHAQHRPVGGNPYGHTHGNMGGHVGGPSMGPHHGGGHVHGHH